MLSCAFACIRLAVDFSEYGYMNFLTAGGSGLDEAQRLGRNHAYSAIGLLHNILDCASRFYLTPEGSGLSHVFNRSSQARVARHDPWPSLGARVTNTMVFYNGIGRWVVQCILWPVHRHPAARLEHPGNSEGINESNGMTITSLRAITPRIPRL